MFLFVFLFIIGIILSIISDNNKKKELLNRCNRYEKEINRLRKTEDAYSLEKKLHSKFCLQRLNKVNKYKEFFTISINEIKEYVESLGIYPLFD